MTSVSVCIKMTWDHLLMHSDANYSIQCEWMSTISLMRHSDREHDVEKNDAIRPSFLIIYE
jgi:hypothetical protein